MSGFSKFCNLVSKNLPPLFRGVAKHHLLRVMRNDYPMHCYYYSPWLRPLCPSPTKMIRITWTKLAPFTIKFELAYMAPSFNKTNWEKRRYIWREGTQYLKLNINNSCHDQKNICKVVGPFEEAKWQPKYLLI